MPYTLTKFHLSSPPINRPPCAPPLLFNSPRLLPLFGISYLFLDLRSCSFRPKALWNLLPPTPSSSTLSHSVTIPCASGWSPVNRQRRGCERVATRSITVLPKLPPLHPVASKQRTARAPREVPM